MLRDSVLDTDNGIIFKLQDYSFDKLFFLFCYHENISKKLNAWWWYRPPVVYFEPANKNSVLYLHNTQLILEPTLLVKKWKEPFTYLEGRCFAHCGESPSTLVPCLVATAPTFTSNPPHPFPTPSAHIILFTTTSTITVFFVRDTSVHIKYEDPKGTIQQDCLLPFY